MQCGSSHTLKLEQLLSSKWKWLRQNFAFIFQTLSSEIIIVTSTIFSAEDFHFSSPSLPWNWEETCWVKIA